MTKFICTLLLLLSQSHIVDIPAYDDIINEERQIYYDEIYYDFILHAGGLTPKGRSGSNSIEAINNSYNLGYRVLEIDFCWTEDNYLACVHDWETYYGYKFEDKKVSLAEFEALRHGTYGFTSLTLDELCQWLKEHDDVTIVTDIKEKCVEGAKFIADRFPELKDKFCIQIYDMSQYDDVNALGYKNIIFTLYQLPWEEKRDVASIVDFAKKNKLVGITFSAELVNQIPGFVENLKKADTPLFVHTVNDVSEQKRFRDMGIAGIYTDSGEGALRNIKIKY